MVLIRMNHFCLLLIISSGSCAYQKIDLDQGWTLRSLEPVDSSSPVILSQAVADVRSQDWIPADPIPAMVQDILLQTGRIEEPWLPGRAREYQWIGESDWIYRTSFSVDDLTQAAYLSFQGLDGIVDIYLNGQWIALHSNMYIPANVYVTDYLVNENVPPSGAVYDPENNGTPLQSLGVHEHWNNPRDRQYSRYPGRKSGIERVSVMN